MMTRQNRTLYEPLADINVTPLVDVMLVLLIVFMITAPMLAAGMNVELPKAAAAQPLEPKQPVIVTVSKDGKIFVGKDEVARDQLVAALRASVDGNRDRVVHVRGDRDARYGDIIAVMDQLASGGFGKVALLANAQPRAAVETR
jgi:biopolymer transport protein ExbD/biopolymer transport protein TolR